MRPDNLHTEILHTEIDEEVAREVAGKDLKPKALAKATAAAQGDQAKTQELYIKFRTEELLQITERDALPPESPTATQIGETEREYECLNCGFKGPLKKEMPISMPFFLIFIPVVSYFYYILYRLIYETYSAVFGLLAGAGVFLAAYGFFATRNLPEKGLCQKCRNIIIHKCEPGD